MDGFGSDVISTIRASVAVEEEGLIGPQAGNPIMKLTAIAMQNIRMNSDGIQRLRSILAYPTAESHSKDFHSEFPRGSLLERGEEDLLKIGFGMASPRPPWDLDHSQARKYSQSRGKRASCFNSAIYGRVR
jgi:hypothetical protein